MRQQKYWAVSLAAVLLCVGCLALLPVGRDKLPEFSVKSVFSGEWMYRFDRMFLEAFPGREALLEVKQGTGSLLGQAEPGSVVNTDKGLIRISAAPESKTITQNIGNIRAFSEELSDAEIYLMLIPGKEELYADLLRNEKLVWDQKKLIDEVGAQLSSYVDEVDAYTALSLHRDEYIFYRTDTRWTTTGAYYAFCELGERLRTMGRELDSFDIEFVTNRYLGNLYKKAQNRNVQSDSIALYHYNYDVRFNKVVYHSGHRQREDASLYRYEYLDGDNLYGVFFGDEYAVFDLLTRRQSAKNLLFIGDDLMNSLVPFLTPSFAKITCVNLQKLAEPLSSVVDLQSYDQVVILESVAQFCENSGLEKLLT